MTNPLSVFVCRYVQERHRTWGRPEAPSISPLHLTQNPPRKRVRAWGRRKPSTVMTKSSSNQSAYFSIRLEQNVCHSTLQPRMGRHADTFLRSNFELYGGYAGHIRATHSIMNPTHTRQTTRQGDAEAGGALVSPLPVRAPFAFSAYPANTSTRTYPHPPSSPPGVMVQRLSLCPCDAFEITETTTDNRSASDSC